MSIGRHRHQPLLLLKKPHTLLPCKAVQEKRTTLCTASLPIALIFIPTANIFLPLRFKMFTRSNRRKARRSSKEIALRLGLTPWRNLKYIRAAGTPRPYEIDKRPANAGALPGCDRNRGQIFYAMPAQDRNSLRLLPQVVRCLVRIGCCSC
jgi:hypothetical protein